GDDPLQRLGKRQVLGRAAFQVELRELLGVERIALRAFQQRLLGLRGKQRTLEHVRDQGGRLLPRERAEPERRRVQLPAAPPGTPLQELGPRAADDQESNPREPVDQLVDEVEQTVVRPVELFMYQNQPMMLGKGFYE